MKISEVASVFTNISSGFEYVCVHACFSTFITIYLKKPFFPFEGRLRSFSVLAPTTATKKWHQLSLSYVI